MATDIQTGPPPEAEPAHAVVLASARPLVPMGDYIREVASPEALEAARQFSAAYDKVCASLIGPNDVQEAEQGKKFKKKSAWRKLARHFQISTQVLERIAGWRESPDGSWYYYAEVLVRATAPWGQSMEALAACTSVESRFNGQKAMLKAGNDVLATAETRATNRAVSNLIAAGEVSAEEVEGSQGWGGPGRQPLRRGAQEPRQTENSARHHASRTGQTTRSFDGPGCPLCRGPMWDNRGSKRFEREPDFRCKDKERCAGMWAAGAWPRMGEQEMEEIHFLAKRIGAAAQKVVSDALRGSPDKSLPRGPAGDFMGGEQMLERMRRRVAETDGEAAEQYREREYGHDHPLEQEPGPVPDVERELAEDFDDPFNDNPPPF